mmetsp:Transcript_22573/g.47372  ORF Transcript_22573/g.47372 Transcript_22573/m.47372 type:complete len:85 (+) Transcript_22573:334-588(+)
MPRHATPSRKRDTTRDAHTHNGGWFCFSAATGVALPCVALLPLLPLMARYGTVVDLLRLRRLQLFYRSLDTRFESPPGFLGGRF